MNAPKRGLTVVVLGFLLMLSGCFGATLDSNLDYLIYPSGGETNINVNGSDFTLAVGDKLELKNTTGTLDTCFYTYFTDNGITVKAGYDPGSKKSDGTAKYSTAHHFWNALAKYKVRILKSGANPVEMQINYGETGGITSNSFAKFSTRGTDGKVSELISIDSYKDDLGDASQRGTALDRTICFRNEHDPLVFEVTSMPFELHLLIPIGDLLLQQEPIQPLPEEEVKEQVENQDSGSVAPGDKLSPSSDTTAQAAGGRSGCGLHRNAPSRTSWGVFGTLLWVPAVLGLLKFRKRA